MGLLRYANAGHNPPMVLRRNDSITWLDAGGQPIGMFPDLTLEEGVVQLDRGDLVLAYSDGVIEAMNPAGEEWGTERLQRAALQCNTCCADEIVSAMFAALDEFSGGHQTDDETLVVLRVRRGAGPCAEGQRLQINVRSGNKCFRMSKVCAPVAQLERASAF